LTEERGSSHPGAPFTLATVLPKEMRALLPQISGRDYSRTIMSISERRWGVPPEGSRAREVADPHPLRNCPSGGTIGAVRCLPTPTRLRVSSMLSAQTARSSPPPRTPDSRLQFFEQNGRERAALLAASPPRVTRTATISVRCPAVGPARTSRTLARSEDREV
jgi:hypothetical protein